MEAGAKEEKKKGNGDSWLCNIHVRKWENGFLGENKYQGCEIITKLALYHPVHWFPMEGERTARDVTHTH